MFKTQRSIASEVERIKEVLMPSKEKTLIIHMWLPDGDPRHKMSESEIIAKGHVEHGSLIIVPLKEKPDPLELKQYLESMAKEEAEKE
jgi:hypothetical protein